MQEIKNFTEKKIVGGLVVLDKELVICILTRLGLEYETIFVNFTS